jgi:hypothetical protein
MDNWSGHHSRLFQHAINKYWANTLRIVFVPPYSPDPASTGPSSARSTTPRQSSDETASAHQCLLLRRRARSTAWLVLVSGPLTAAAVAATVRSVDARCNESAITLLRRARHAGYAIQQSWLCAEFDRISPAVMRH